MRDPFESLQRRRTAGRRNERLLAGTVSMALVGGLLAGTLTVLAHSQHGTGTTLPGGAGLSGSGGAVGQPGTFVQLGDGQYLYMKQTLALHGDTFSTETWWATDGSGRERITCSNQTCVTDSSPGFVDSYGSPGDTTYGAGQFPIDDDLTGLSTDPDTLRQQLLERTAPSGHSPEPAFSPGPELTPGVTVGSMLDAIENILSDPNGDPALKAAVFQVAAGVQGVDVKPGVTDPVGRPATVLAIPGLDGGNGTNWYFDPTTDLLMGYGPTDGSKLFTFDQGIVASTDDTPSGDQWVFPPAP